MASIFGHIKEEMPKYEEIEKNANFQIRQYGPVIVAETTFKGTRGRVKTLLSSFLASPWRTESAEVFHSAEAAEGGSVHLRSLYTESCSCSCAPQSVT